MNELLVMRPDGTTDLIPNDFDAIKAGLDGSWMEFMKVTDEVGMFIDEEGKLNGDLLNVPASILTGRPVYGPAVLSSGDTDPEGDVLPPSESLVTTAYALGRCWMSVRRNAEGQNLDFPADPSVIPPPQVTVMNDSMFLSLLDGQTRG